LKYKILVKAGIMKKAKIILLMTLILFLPINGFININCSKDFNEGGESNNLCNDLRFSSTFENEFIPAWNVTWGGDFDDVAFKLALDSSRDIYLAGFSSYLNGSLVKFNSSGQYQWNRTWGTITNFDLFEAIAIDSSDNIYLVGFTENYFVGNRDICLIKYNKSGDLQWNYTWGENYEESGRAIALDSSENIYFAGNIDYNSQGIYDMVIVKYNKSGYYQWNYTWGGSEDDICLDMTLDSLGNIYLTGATYNPGLNNYDICLVKFNNLGQYQWNRTWTGKYDDFAYDIALDSSENIYLVGYTESSIDGNLDMCLLKYNNLGQYQWNRTWDENLNDVAMGIAIDSSDNIYLAGTTGDRSTNIFKFCLLKYNQNGILLWSHTWGTWGIEGSEALHDIVLDSRGDIYLVGVTNTSGTGGFNNDDMILLKYLRMEPPIIESPNENDIFGFATPTFNISINDLELNTTWYTVNNGKKVVFQGVSGIIDQTEWEKAGNGTVNLKFYLNNTLGYEGYSQVVVRKDIIDPILIVNNPINGEEFDVPPAFNISIEEPNLESFWYTIDGGQVNITLTETIGIIDQNIWDLVPNGHITVKFSAKDKVGNIGYKEVSIIKISSEDTSASIPGYNLIVLVCLTLTIVIILGKKNYC